MGPRIVLLAAAAVLAGHAPAAWAAPAVITTVAGGGSGLGDGGPATSAQLNQPFGVAVAADGALLIADSYHHRIRRVAADGTITTIAGTGVAGFSGDGGPATEAQLNLPTKLATDGSGAIFFTDTLNHRVRRIAPDGRITTIAGTGVAGFSGDGGAATSAQLSYPQGIVIYTDGAVLVSDTLNARVRRVTADGTITTFAGGGSGYPGDGGSATEAQLGTPLGLAVGAGGVVLIADHRGDRDGRVRSVSPAGVISTIAGGGPFCDVGDGGPATQACLRTPAGVAVGHDGSVFVSDGLAERVRRIDPAGTISTVAGTGVGGVTGDGGPATLARLSNPLGVAVTGNGTLFIADTNNGRVRRVAAADTEPPTISAQVSPQANQAGWHNSDVTVAFSCSDAGSGVASCPEPVTVSSESADRVVSGTATDQAGNSASTSAVVSLDKTAPEVSCPATPPFTLGDPGASLTARVTDSLSGPVAAQVTANVPTSAAGPGTVQVTGEDQAGNTRTAACPFNVRYALTSFAAPIDAPPTVNDAKAGQTVPVNWTVRDASGAPITDPAHFVSVTSGAGTCSTSDPTDVVETYSGTTGLQYLGDGQWQFNWKTDKAYAGQCRVMSLNLADGSRTTAYFQFK